MSLSKHHEYPPIISLPRLSSLLACLLVAICSGTNYVYSAYAPQLGTRLQINHTQLNIVGLAGNFGVYLTSPFWGRIVDAHGPRGLLFSGFFLLLAGYSGIRFIFNAGIPPGADTIPTSTFCALVACKLMTGAGGNCGIMSALNTSAKTFPDRARGLATGIVVSGFGLSAFLFSTAARMAFASDTSSFLKLLAYGTAFPMIIGIFFVRPIPLPPTADNHTIGDIDEEHGRGSGSGEEERLLSPHHDSRYAVIPPIPPTSGDRDTNNHNHTDLPTQSQPNLRGKALFTNSDFWLFFCILSLLTGVGLMYINNVGSMSQALYLFSTLNNSTKVYDPAEASRWQAAQVSTISLTNFAGRIAIGLTSDHLKKLSLPRSTSLSLVSLLFLSSQLASALTTSVSQLWIPSLALGFAHGSVFSLGPVVCIELFGMRHFSENWGWLIMSPVFGGNVLSLAFGRDMDRHSVGLELESEGMQREGGREGRCELGRECYVDTLYLTMGVCVVAFGLSVWAGVRDWRRGRGRGAGGR